MTAQVTAEVVVVNDAKGVGRIIPVLTRALPRRSRRMRGKGGEVCGWRGSRESSMRVQSIM